MSTRAESTEGAALRGGEAWFRTMAKSAQTVCAGIVTRLGDAGKSKLGAVRLSPQPCGEASRAVAAWLARTEDTAEIGIVPPDFEHNLIPSF